MKASPITKSKLTKTTKNDEEKPKRQRRYCLKKIFKSGFKTFRDKTDKQQILSFWKADRFF